MSNIDSAGVAAAIAVVRQRVVDAGGDATVAILPVTKGFGPEAITAAVAAGCTAVGESYAQELVAKRDALRRGTGTVEVHFIGQLQTNKIRQLSELVDVYESLDRPKLAAEIAKRAPAAKVLIQVDTSQEPGKGGCPIDQVDEFAEHVRQCGLDLAGLMTVGPTSGGPQAARAGFRLVRQAVDRLGLTVCSMGMTGDLEVAVQEGSTQIRIGTALFGSRPVHAWREQQR